MVVDLFCIKIYNLYMLFDSESLVHSAQNMIELTPAVVVDVSKGGDLLLGHTKLFLVSSEIWEMCSPVRENRRFDRFYMYVISTGDPSSIHLVIFFQKTTYLLSMTSLLGI